jgi:hypothetical protein
MLHTPLVLYIIYSSLSSEQCNRYERYIEVVCASWLKRALKSEHDSFINFSRNNQSHSGLSYFSRSNWVWDMSSRLFGSSNGVLFCSRLYLGSNSWCFRSCHYHRVQYRFRFLSGCMRRRASSSNIVKVRQLTCALCIQRLAKGYKSLLIENSQLTFHGPQWTWHI